MTDSIMVKRVYGPQVWWQEYKMHRVDGPAIPYTDGSEYWYLDGIQFWPENMESNR